MSWSFWNKLTDPTPQPALDRGAAQRRMVALAPPIISTASAHADAAGWRIRAEEAEKALTAECDAHADTIKLVERLRATPTPDDLWLEVRISEQGQRARKFARMYGRASATIGDLRAQLALAREQRNQLQGLIDAVSLALGCGIDPSVVHLLDVAHRGKEALAADGVRFRREWLAAARAFARYCPRCDQLVEALPERRVCDECEREVGTRDLSLTAVLQSGPSTGPRYVVPGGAHPADADAELIEKARVLGDELGQRDQTGALGNHSHPADDSAPVLVSGERVLVIAEHGLADGWHDGVVVDHGKNGLAIEVTG